MKLISIPEVLLFTILLSAGSCKKDTYHNDLSESMESEHYIYYYSPGDSLIDTSWQEWEEFIINYNE